MEAILNKLVMDALNAASGAIKILANDKPSEGVGMILAQIKNAKKELEATSNEQSKMVYVVIDSILLGSGYGDQMVGVFSTEEKAKEHTLATNDGRVEAFEIDKHKD